MNYVFIMGRNIELSKIELKTVLEKREIRYSPLLDIGKIFAIRVKEKMPTDLFDQLGGCEKIAQLMDDRRRKKWRGEDVIKALSPTANKWLLGISAYGLNRRGTTDLMKETKREGEKMGMRISYILPKSNSPTLNAAQVIFNKLTKKPNYELLLIKINNEYSLANTIWVQDIQAYEMRDTRRPARDARVGLLPPKLAQMMLNIVPDLSNKESLVYDPFCGMGTVLQEGWIMGYRMYGSDISKTMVAAAEKNMEWLINIRHDLDMKKKPRVAVHDARVKFEKLGLKNIDAIVTEPHLGEPLGKPITEAEYTETISRLQNMYKEFFDKATEILAPRAYVVFALPAYRVREESGGKIRIHRWPRNIIDEIEGLGYSFKHLSQKGGILYGRPKAMVLREITLWRIKKQAGQHN